MKKIPECATVRLVSANDMLERVAEAEEEVYGYADGDSLEEDMDDSGIDCIFSFGVFFVNVRIK